ncbi:hypothetical protein Nepgr_010352 [Nepenthes gracilis]|uniref:Uncharacterized protein n=1 Tax=Nepenthes gracilis TaxID=150966 RepID=A0AAD3SCG8_NEPGR|nr:hypothetical protein Nepgr_010352 [Nepenthes gracilis]
MYELITNKLKNLIANGVGTTYCALQILDACLVVEAAGNAPTLRAHSTSVLSRFLISQGFFGGAQSAVCQMYVAGLKMKCLSDVSQWTTWYGGKIAVAGIMLVLA